MAIHDTEPRVFLIDTHHQQTTDLADTEDEHLTTRQVAELWTKRAAQMGYLHYYKPDSVRQASKQHRITANPERIGTNRLFLRKDVEQADIRPWMRILYQGKEAAGRLHPCAKCGTLVPAEELAWRSWYWCVSCQIGNPRQWEAYKWGQFQGEEAEKRSICREALRRSDGVA